MKESTVSRESERLTRRTIPGATFQWTHSRLPAWLLSVVLHTFVLLALAILWTAPTKGISKDRGGSVGIAVAYQQSGEESYYLTDDQQPSDSQSMQATLPGLAGVDAAAAEQDKLMSGLLAAVDSAGDSAASGNLGLGDGNVALPEGGRGKPVTTEVFGVQGEGSRFVYVFDRSDSMNGYEGKPLRRAQSELLKSLQSLGPTHQFQIIFYNDTPLPYGGFAGGGPKLLRGEPVVKTAAAQFIQDISAIGGTNHIDALRMALAMNPDVVFFLTDADFPVPPVKELENILTRAARGATALHCIQFGEGNRTGRSGWIQQLAQQSGGQYRYIDVSQF
jgi:hypothetical protein